MTIKLLSSLNFYFRNVFIVTIFIKVLSMNLCDKKYTKATLGRS